MKVAAPTLGFGLLLLLVHVLGFDLLWSVFVMAAFILAGLVLLYSANLPTARPSKVGASA